MYSILLIEDHLGFAKAIRNFLSQKKDLEVVDTAHSAEEALRKLRELKIDVALVDVSLPTMDGIELVRQIHTEFPHVRCLMLSGHMSSKYVKDALGVGASGYILKDDANGILEGIPRVLAGEIYVSQTLRNDK